MFSEYEVAAILEIPEVLKATQELKTDFLRKEAKYLEICDHDFLSLVFMTPTIGIALANGNISLFEEIGLNKLARKMSKGGYFFKADPVAGAMKFLNKNFDFWEHDFLEVIKICISKTVDIEHLKMNHVPKDDSLVGLTKVLMDVPYIFVRYLTCFFLRQEVEILEEHKIIQVEFDKIKYYGEKLGIHEIPIFISFLNSLSIK